MCFAVGNPLVNLNKFMDCLISIDVMIFNCNFQFDIPK